MRTVIHFLASQGALFLALLLTMAAAGVSQAEDQPKATFRTQEVKRGTVVQTVRSTGTLEPEDIVDVGAQVAGQIVKLPIDFGSRVNTGDILAQIDDSLYRARVEKMQAQVQLARANLKVLEAELAQALKERDRAKLLFERSAISREDYDITMHKTDAVAARVEVGKADVAKAEAELKEAKINLDYTTIRSPIAGVVIDRRVNVGQTVATGLNVPSLFLIAKDLKHLRLWVSVAEVDIGQIRNGQSAMFTCDAFPGKLFEGKVTQVRLNATRTNNVVTYTVVVSVDNSDGKLLPYLTADVRFIIAEKKGVLLVPNAALKWRPRPEQGAADARAEFAKEPPRVDTVWVADKGFVRPIKLRLGVTDGAVTEALEGDVKEGTAVVVGGPKGTGTGKADAGILRPDMLLIQPGAGAAAGATFGVGSITPQDAAAIQKDCPAVHAVAPVVRARTPMVRGERNWVPLYIYGTTPSFLDVREWDVAEGRNFTDKDVAGSAKVCVVGQTIVKELFEGKSPIGKEIRISGVRFEVVGVLESKGANLMGLDQDDLVLAPWTTIKSPVAKPAASGDQGKGVNSLNQVYPTPSADQPLYPTPSADLPSGSVDQILVRAASADQTKDAIREIATLLRERHRLKAGTPDDFDIRSR